MDTLYNYRAFQFSLLNAASKGMFYIIQNLYVNKLFAEFKNEENDMIKYKIPFEIWKQMTNLDSECHIAILNRLIRYDTSNYFDMKKDSDENTYVYIVSNIQSPK